MPLHHKSRVCGLPSACILMFGPVSCMHMCDALVAA